MSFSEKRYTHGVNLVNIGKDGSTRVQRLDYEPLRQLISIPQNGVTPPDGVRYEVQKLPLRRNGDDGAQWPYLEIHFVQEQPEPELMTEVSRLLQDKAVHFCRMVPHTHSPKEHETELSVERLKDFSPLEMAQRIYREIYDEYMPEEMETRFRIALEEMMGE